MLNILNTCTYFIPANESMKIIGFKIEKQRLCEVNFLKFLYNICKAGTQGWVCHPSLLVPLYLLTLGYIDDFPYYSNGFVSQIHYFSTKSHKTLGSWATFYFSLSGVMGINKKYW